MLDFLGKIAWECQISGVPNSCDTGLLTHTLTSYNLGLFETGQLLYDLVEQFAVKGLESGWNIYTTNLRLLANLDSLQQHFTMTIHVHLCLLTSEWLSAAVVLWISVAVALLHL